MLPFITMSASSSAEVGDLFITASRLPLKNLISPAAGCTAREVPPIISKSASERFLVEHYVGLDDTAAGAAGNSVGGGDELQPVGLPALHAVIAPNRAVQLYDVFAARVGVQSVDVLGHDCG